MRRLLVLLAVLVVAVATTAAAVQGDKVVGPGGGTPGTAKHFKLIGHDPLFARGMNAAPALYEDDDRTFVYVGNRTDGQARHVRPGILIVDVTKPRKPTVVGEIPVSVAAPNAAGTPEGVTSRELRVWPDKKLLIELTFRCSSVIHDCPPGNDTTFPFDYKFFDLSDPVHPRLISRHVTRSQAGVAIKPHEFYLWIDPENEDRALLWESTPSTSVDPARPQFVIEDISDVPDGGPVRLVAQGNWNSQFEGGGAPAAYDNDLSVHSMAPTFDGTLTHLSYLRGEYLALDTSKVAKNQVPPGTVENLNDDLLTRPENRPRWGTGNSCPGHTAAGCAESHSSVPVPGRPYVLNVDEVYGTFTAPSFGWPWGWVRLIGVVDPTHPAIVGEYKIHQNTTAFVPDPVTEQFTSYSSHNPTVLPELALDAWHSGGLQAIDISDPAQPTQAGWFSPTPLSSVATEDPALSRGPNKVVMWSYPIIHDGLVYVVDIRNGLYILRYKGEGADEVKDIDFFEGNSNLGDAGEFAGDEGDEDDG
jgi:hypothetical protein